MQFGVALKKKGEKRVSNYANKLIRIEHAPIGLGVELVLESEQELGVSVNLIYANSGKLQNNFSRAFNKRKEV